MANALIIEPYDISSVTASVTDAGYAGANMGTDYMGLVWQGTGTSFTLDFDLGSDKAIDSVTLLGLSGATTAWNWSVNTATAAQGPSFTASTNVVATSQMLAGSVLNAAGLGKAFATFGAITGRYVRFVITPPASATLRIARAIIGDAFQLVENFRFGASFGVRPLGNVEFSVRGVLLRRTGTKLRSLSIGFANASRSEVETSIQPLLERRGNDKPICIVTDPDANAQRINRIYFGFLAGGLGTVWARLGGFEADFSMVCID